MPPRRRRSALALLVVSAALGASAPVDASAASPPSQPKTSAKRPPALRPVAARHGATAHLAPSPGRGAAPSKSVGSPTDGHIVGGVHLAAAPYLRVVPSYADGDVRWGIEPLVTLVERAARAVRAKFPDAVLSIGHMSKQGGGELDRHASHESGRDADLAFYVKNAAGKPIYADRFVAFDGDGNAKTWPGAKFDDARNWALVAALVGDGHAHVTHVFVATPIRTRLLAFAQKIGAPLSLRVRASEVMAQPRGAQPHDDHFHVRIACPPGMEQCIEQPLRRARHGAASASATASAHDRRAHTAHGRSTPPPAPSHAPPAKNGDDEAESAKSESVPNLGQPVPGLDSAVIPAPLAKPTWGAGPSAAPAPSPSPSTSSSEPISDPDGVLDGH